MNFNQKIINLYKMYKYLWITKKNIFIGCIFYWFICFNEINKIYSNLLILSFIKSFK